MMCSAVGQGALAIETRAERRRLRRVRRCSTTPTRTPPCTAERGVLGALGGGCQVPIGAHATVCDGRVRIRRDRGLARWRG